MRAYISFMLMMGCACALAGGSAKRTTTHGTSCINGNVYSLTLTDDTFAGIPQYLPAPRARLAGLAGWYLPAPRARLAGRSRGHGAGGPLRRRSRRRGARGPQRRRSRSLDRHSGLAGRRRPAPRARLAGLAGGCLPTPRARARGPLWRRGRGHGAGGPLWCRGPCRRPARRLGSVCWVCCGSVRDRRVRPGCS